MHKFQSGSGFVFGNAEFLVVQLCPEIKCTPRFFFFFNYEVIKCWQKTTANAAVFLFFGSRF